MTDTLERRARRAYELGRLRVALRVLVVVAPIVAAGFIDFHSHTRLWSTGALLAALTVALRWRSRHGTDDVTTGLQAGLPALALGLVSCRLLGCPVFSWSTPYGAACVGIGVVAGAWIGMHARRDASFGPGRWLGTIAVSSLVGAVGCAGVGLGSLVAIIATMAMSSAAVAVSRGRA